MLDQDHDDADAGDRGQELAHALGIGIVEPGRGFVEQQHARTDGERARDLDEALVDVRERPR